MSEEDSIACRDIETDLFSIDKQEHPNEKMQRASRIADAYFCVEQNLREVSRVTEAPTSFVQVLEHAYNHLEAQSSELREASHDLVSFFEDFYILVYELNEIESLREKYGKDSAEWVTLAARFNQRLARNYYDVLDSDVLDSHERDLLWHSLLTIQTGLSSIIKYRKRNRFGISQIEPKEVQSQKEGLKSVRQVLNGAVVQAWLMWEYSAAGYRIYAPDPDDPRQVYDLDVSRHIDFVAVCELPHPEGGVSIQAIFVDSKSGPRPEVTRVWYNDSKTLHAIYTSLSSGDPPSGGYIREFICEHLQITRNPDNLAETEKQD